MTVLNYNFRSDCGQMMLGAMEEVSVLVQRLQLHVVLMRMVMMLCARKQRQ